MCNVHCTYLVYTTYNIYTEKLSVTLPCLWNIIQLLCNIIPPSMTLHMWKKVIELQNWWQKIKPSTAKHPLRPIICRHNLKTPLSKADDVICERPLLPKLSTKTSINQEI